MPLMPAGRSRWKRERKAVWIPAPYRRGKLDDAVTVHGKYGLDVHLNGELFTTYHHAANHNKLFLYPVIGPTGKGMTRGYPMVSDIPGEKHDHPHHKSIHVAHGDVNGVDTLE